jgi:hypothetical protein
MKKLPEFLPIVMRNPIDGSMKRRSLPGHQFSAKNHILQPGHIFWKSPISLKYVSSINCGKRRERSDRPSFLTTQIAIEFRNKGHPAHPTPGIVILHATDTGGFVRMLLEYPHNGSCPVRLCHAIGIQKSQQVTFRQTRTDISGRTGERSLLDMLKLDKRKFGLDKDIGAVGGTVDHHHVHVRIARGRRQAAQTGANGSLLLYDGTMMDSFLLIAFNPEALYPLIPDAGSREKRELTTQRPLP